MLDYFIRMFDLLQGVTLMTTLTASLFATGFAKASLFRRADKAVRGRWFRRIMTILRKTLFQSLNAFYQLSIQSSLGSHLLSKQGIFSFKLAYFLFRCHSSIVYQPRQFRLAE